MAVGLEMFVGIQTRRQVSTLHIAGNVKKLDHFVFVTAMVLLPGTVMWAVTTSAPTSHTLPSSMDVFEHIPQQ